MITSTCIRCNVALLCMTDFIAYEFQCHKCKRFFIQISGVKHIEIFNRKRVPPCILTKVDFNQNITCKDCGGSW